MLEYDFNILYYCILYIYFIPINSGFQKQLIENDLPITKTYSYFEAKKPISETTNWKWSSYD